jgi:hypothetical protein
MRSYDRNEIIPFEMNDEKDLIILFPLDSRFVL